VTDKIASPYRTVTRDLEPCIGIYIVTGRFLVGTSEYSQFRRRGVSGHDSEVKKRHANKGDVS
jgi:hypothetical protein